MSEGDDPAFAVGSGSDDPTLAITCTARSHKEGLVSKGDDLTRK
ncbi:MAG: hypothetical protein ACJAZ8_002407 [Planctomycetota bacterium]|jgi:hypothetical protein